MSLAGIVNGSLFRLGSSGPTVGAIQIALRGLGYGLKGTGYFGNATDTAVRAFQRRSDIKVDGVVGGDTAKAIDAGFPTGASDVAEIKLPLWVQAGLPLIGLHEGPGASDNPTLINWAKEEGGDIARSYTHDSIPWCALFANHLLTKVGLPGTETLWALDFAGKWPSKQLHGLAVGAFAPMLRNGGGHIIVVVGRSRNGNVMGLGGNQSDAVSIEEFPVARLNKGFWWPDSVPLPDQIGFDRLPIISSSGKISTNEA